MSVSISEPISHPKPDGGAAGESYTFKLTNVHYSIISIQKHKRCQWRTFSNLWHFLFWLEHQTLENILKIYILYINILERYLWTARHIQTYKHYHSRVGFSEVVPLLFAPRSANLFKWIFLCCHYQNESIITEWTQPSSDRRGIFAFRCFQPSC